MRYAIIDKDRCLRIGINPLHRRQMGSDVVITEKELMFSAAKGETVEDKAQTEGVELITIGEVQERARQYDNQSIGD